jgi:hypothetical protein
MRLSWTEILEAGGIPEAPGYVEAKEKMRLKREKEIEEGVVVVKKAGARKSATRRKAKARVTVDSIQQTL